VLSSVFLVSNQSAVTTANTYSGCNPRKSKRTSKIIMPDTDANKAYVERQIDIAKNAATESAENNALYRAGTQMEVLPCDGNANLTTEQQNTVYEAADWLLGE
jgi:hypothetical protein